jgi:hypothetical protein
MIAMDMKDINKETWPEPKLYHSILFFILLSGPPRLCLRDPDASLAAEVDAAILLALGVWLVVQVVRRGTIPRLSSVQVLAIRKSPGRSCAHRFDWKNVGKSVFSG